MDAQELQSTQWMRKAEAAHKHLAQLFVTAYASCFPERCAGYKAIGGAATIYAGPDYPANRCLGIGLEAMPAPAELISAVEEFYTERKATPCFEITPLAGNALQEHLSVRGYRTRYSLSVYGRLLPVDTPPTPPEIHVDALSPENIGTWLRVVPAGFREGHEQAPDYSDLYRAFIRMPQTVPWLAEIGGKAAGGGVIAFVEGCALLFGTSVLPPYRRRGVQTALIHARLREAAAQGANAAFVEVTPGSASEHVVRNCGFTFLYRRERRQQSTYA